jgi:DNA-binding winged helix-turn-helix (wHTH) protein
MSLEALRQILRRTDASAAALFGADEVAAWPAGSKETLTTLGLLREDAPARAIVCPGCDLQCLKEVEVVGEGSAARGLLFCDQRDDMEPIEIPLERLRRWSADVGGLTSSLALLLDGSRQAEEVVRGRLWWLGRGSAADGGDVFLACGTRRDDAAAIFGHPQVFRGRSVPVVLTLSDVPAGGVFGENVGAVPLGRVLSVEDGRLCLDRQAVTAAARFAQQSAQIAHLRPSAADDAVLVVREASHQAYLSGKPLSLTPRVLKLLALLARQVVEEGGGWVRREAVYDAIFSPQGEEPRVYMQQVDDTVKELRRALNAVESDSGTRLVETKRRVGYRLSLSPSDIALM